MRAILALASAAGLFLAGSSARAETWSVLDGRVTDAATGRSHSLSGWLEGSEFEPDPPDGASPVVTR